MSAVSVRAMLPEDADRVQHLWYQSWVDTYVRPDLGVTREWVDTWWKRRLSPDGIEALAQRVAAAEHRSDQFFFVAERDGALIGVATPFITTEGVQRVGALYVERQHLGTGTGAALMTAVLDALDPARPILLQVAGYNSRAIAFYEQFGFTKIDGSEEFDVGTVPDFWMRREPR